MKASRDSKTHKFYRFFYGIDANSNLCDYFWQLVLAAVTFPIAWFKDSWRGKSSQESHKRFISYKILKTFLPNILIILFYGLSNVMGSAILGYGGNGNHFGYYAYDWYAGWIFAPLLGAFAISLFIYVFTYLIIFCGEKIKSLDDYFYKKRVKKRIQKKSEVKESKQKNPSIIKSRFKAWKNKHCPIIDWEKDEPK